MIPVKSLPPDDLPTARFHAIHMLQHRFSCKGRTFEIRASRTPDSLLLVVFESGTPTGVRAGITIAPGTDYAKYGHRKAAKPLADALENYVRDVLEHT